MSDSERPRKDHAGQIAQWLAIAAILAGIVARFISLEEAKAIAETRHTELKGRVDKAEDRIREIENSRTIEMQINVLTAEVVALKVQVSGLREELRAKRR